jgi:hypothetical protein
MGFPARLPASALAAVEAWLRWRAKNSGEWGACRGDVCVVRGLVLLERSRESHIYVYTAAAGILEPRSGPELYRHTRVSKQPSAGRHSQVISRWVVRGDAAQALDHNRTGDVQVSPDLRGFVRSKPVY